MIEFCSVTKNNEILVFETTQVELEIIILNYNYYKLDIQRQTLHNVTYMVEAKHIDLTTAKSRMAVIGG
jgi:hypothetical protein